MHARVLMNVVDGCSSTVNILQLFFVNSTSGDCLINCTVEDEKLADLYIYIYIYIYNMNSEPSKLLIVWARKLSMLATLSP